VSTSPSSGYCHEPLEPGGYDFMTRAPGEGEKQRNATPLWLHFEKEIQRELGFAQILEIGKSTEIYTSHQQRTSGKLCKMADFEAQRPSQVIRSMCIFDLMV